MSTLSLPLQKNLILAFQPNENSRLGGGYIEDRNILEPKTRILLLSLGIFITIVLLISSSYAYFTSKVSSEGNNKIDVAAKTLASAKMDYGSSIIATNIYPGNKILKTITVTGSGPDNAVPIKATITLTPDVTDFSNHVKYTMYAVENSNIDATTICESPKPTTESGMYYDAMKCDTSSLGSPILSGTFSGKTKVNYEIEVTSKTNTTYYLIVEYVNDEENPQNNEQGKTFVVNIGFKASGNNNEATGLVQLATLVNGKLTTDLPSKYDKYVFDSVECDNGAIATWNSVDWNITIDNLTSSNTSCTITFVSVETLANHIINASETDDTIIEVTHGETIQTGSNALVDYRYVGSNPNNYVCLEDSGVCSDNQLYRIIGVIPTQASEDGEYENRVKLIKSTVYTTMAWNSNNSNDYNTSPLINTLSTTYLGSISSYEKYIDDAKWYIGGRADYNATASTFYTNERGTTVYSGRPISVISKIGLMYPSDYGFAVGGSVRNTCLGYTLYNWRNQSTCYNNNWLNENDARWTITPINNGNWMFVVSKMVSFSNSNISTAKVYPVFYLKPDVGILSGDGTKTSPWLLKV